MVVCICAGREATEALEQQRYDLPILDTVFGQVSVARIEFSGTSLVLTQGPEILGREWAGQVDKVIVAFLSQKSHRVGQASTLYRRSGSA